MIFYYLHCFAGTTHNGALWAKKMGYSKVLRYPGGIFAWKGADYPTESAK
jgi:rhodanese-related sulfurtransferase